MKKILFVAAGSMLISQLCEGQAHAEDVLVGHSVYADAGTELPTATSSSNDRQETVEESVAETDEILVTAQRRSENLQDVPFAITALSSDRLEASGVSSTQDLQLVTPGLQFVSGAGSSQPRLRGIGSAGIGPGVENAVATYIDNVYIGAQTGLVLPFNNISQVAVLKGPQGTLFGRNATGGVIQITTLDPQHQFGAKVSATYGNRDTYGANAYVTSGISDNIAANLSLFYNNISDGFGTNIVTGNKVGKEETLSLRSKILFDPGPVTQILISGDYSRLRTDTPSYRPLYGSIATGGYIFTAGKFDISSDSDPHTWSDAWGVSGQITHDFDALKILSVTAYRHVDFRVTFDVDRLPQRILDTDVTQIDHQFSQELQLQSRSEGNLDWVIGAYYYSSSGRYDPYLSFFNRQPADTAQQIILSRQTSESIAGFAQADYHFGEDTTLTAGFRYTYEKRKFDAESFDELLDGTLRPTDETEGELSFGKPTWRLSLDHRFSPELLAYLSYSRGSKSGAFNATGFPAQPVDPETLDDYEIGIKSNLFDRRVRLNIAGYYYDYSNIQLNRFSGPVQIIYNAEGARVYGVDVDFDAVLSDRLTLRAGVNITDSKFRNFPDAVSSVPRAGGGFNVVPADATGNRIQKTPNWTANLSGEYSLPLADGSVDFTVDYYHSDGWFAEPDNRLRQDPYDTLAASILWNLPDGRSSVRLWGKNLTNAVYAVTITSSSRSEVIWPAQGRTFGITVGTEFN